MTEKIDDLEADTARQSRSIRTSRTGDVLEVVLDRPSARNALDHAMTDELVRILTVASVDDTLRALHLRGGGENFCAGADWVGTNTRSEPDSTAAADRPPRPRAGDLVRRVPHGAHRVVELVHTMALPVVCSVRGWAVGLGCNLALAADFTVAADDAVFWEPFLRRGFSPDSGSTWLLPRLVGVARARRMLLLGEKVDGSRAADWGLIHDSVPAADLDGAAAELLDRLASGPTVAFGFAKQALAESQQSTLPDAMDRELLGLEISSRTHDFKEGLAAFRERRPARFDGR